MIFDPSDWALVKRLRADKKSLISEYSAQGQNVQVKANPPTTFGRPLYDGQASIFSFIMDPTLWSEDERRGAHGGKGLASMNKIYSHLEECPTAASIVSDFPAIRQMFWTMLPPGHKVTPHYGIGGVIHGRASDHWRLQICWEPGDGNAAFWLKDKKLVYTEDLCFGFHDGMELHWAENNGSTPRTVLILDVHRHLCESADVPHPMVTDYV